MHDPEEVYHLLNIAHLANNWPELHPLRNRALDKLKQIAHEHEEKTNDKPTPRPIPAFRPVAKKEE